MKKGKFLIGAVVLSLGLLGTGYAYWTDQVSIGATVETGNLDVGLKKVGTVEYKYYHKDGNKVGMNGTDVYGFGETKIISPGTNVGTSIATAENVAKDRKSVV